MEPKKLETYEPCDDEKLYRILLSRMTTAAEKVKKETYGLHRAIESLCDIGFVGSTKEQIASMMEFDKSLRNVHWLVDENEIYLSIPEMFDTSYFEDDFSSFQSETSTFNPVEVIGIVTLYRNAIIKAEANFLPGAKTSTKSKGFAGKLLAAIDEFLYAFLDYVYPQ